MENHDLLFNVASMTTEIGSLAALTMVRRSERSLLWIWTSAAGSCAHALPCRELKVMCSKGQARINAAGVEKTSTAHSRFSNFSSRIDTERLSSKFVSRPNMVKEWSPVTSCIHGRVSHSYTLSESLVMASVVKTVICIRIKLDANNDPLRRLELQKVADDYEH